MNRSMIRYILGYVLTVEGLLLLPICLAALYFHERAGVYYLAVALPALACGLLLIRKKPRSTVFYLKEGCVSTALSWIVLSLVGCLPLWLSREIPSFTDALFETISGFTTTGASIVANVEGLSHCALLWRSLTHWIGGMGVLVFLLAVVPMSGGSHMNLMRAESPGPSVGKLVPRVRTTARILYLIYMGLTALELLFLLAGRMPTFDAVCTSLATAGTGGFGVRNDSLASYSPYLQWVVSVFMLLFAVNFNMYYLLLLRHYRDAFSMEEVRCFFGMVGVAVVLVFASILRQCAGVFDALTQTVFQVASVVSSTGFATADFNLWPDLARSVLVLLMFVGACAGSIGGGLKVSRLVILLKSIRKEFGMYIHPRSVKKIKMDGKPIEHEVVRSTNVYFITFMLVFAGSFLVVTSEGGDLITDFTAVIATLNNIGPGLGLVSPAGNYGMFTPLSKWVLMFDMLAGRLELFPMLILFHPAIWKDMAADRKKKLRQ